MAYGNAGNLVGRTLGSYRLVALLGKGGMADVYRGRDNRLRRDVAVKVLPPMLAADASYVERFRSEGRRVAALRHPNIVEIYEFGEQEGLLYLVMPLAPESLRDRMHRGGPLPIADAIGFAIQVAGALEAAHAQGIVHRDVKPENVLIGPDGRALLTDFGIARELAYLRRDGNMQTLAATGLPVGTPEYMAPEQLRNGPIDQRADVYALGAVLYELLTGEAPHEADTPYEVAALALTVPIVPPSQLNPKVWPDLETAVMWALASDLQERYPRVASFAQALRQASRRGMGGVLRATLPIFRKTAIVDPYEGPTDQVLVVGGSPSGQLALPARMAAYGRALPTAPGRRASAGDGGSGRRRFLRIAALLALAVVIAGSGGALLHGIIQPNGFDPFGFFAFGRTSVGATATTAPVPTATATTAPTATPTQPPATSTPVPTATPVPLPTLSITPKQWVLHRSSQYSSYCVSYLPNDQPGGAQTVTNTSQDAVSWFWVSVSPSFPTTNFTFRWRRYLPPPAPVPGWNSGSTPQQTSQAPGTSFAYDVLMTCKPAQTYTITVEIVDIVTHVPSYQTITLVDPGY
ncbi:MAG: serine/threonine-protein kinase [Ktedonobacterales bacterium]